MGEPIHVRKSRLTVSRSLLIRTAPFGITSSFRMVFTKFPLLRFPQMASNHDPPFCASNAARKKRGTSTTPRNRPCPPRWGRSPEREIPSVPVTAASRRVGGPAHATIPALSRGREKCLSAYPDELPSCTSRLPKFRPGLGWKDANADDFRAFLFELMKSGRARSSIRLAFAALRSFYHFLVVRKVLDTNVLKAVDIPKTEKELPRFLTVSQVESLLEKPSKIERQKQAPALVGLPRRGDF